MKNKGKISLRLPRIENRVRNVRIMATPEDERYFKKLQAMAEERRNIEKQEKYANIFKESILRVLKKFGIKEEQVFFNVDPKGGMISYGPEKRSVVHVWCKFAEIESLDPQVIQTIKERYEIEETSRLVDISLDGFSSQGYKLAGIKFAEGKIKISELMVAINSNSEKEFSKKIEIRDGEFIEIYPYRVGGIHLLNKQAAERIAKAISEVVEPNVFQYIITAIQEPLGNRWDEKWAERIPQEGWAKAEEKINEIKRNFEERKERMVKESRKRKKEIDEKINQLIGGKEKMKKEDAIKYMEYLGQQIEIEKETIEELKKLTEEYEKKKKGVMKELEEEYRKNWVIEIAGVLPGVAYFIRDY